MSGSSLARCLLAEEQSEVRPHNSEWDLTPLGLNVPQRWDEEETSKVEWVKRVRWCLCSEELKTKKVMTAIRVNALAYWGTATLEIAFFFFFCGGVMGEEYNNQAKEVISFDRVKCCTCPDYAAMTKWSARVQSISVSFGTDKAKRRATDHRTWVISPPCFRLAHLNELLMSSRAAHFPLRVLDIAPGLSSNYL